jgi:hypothetical protein
MEMSFRTLVLLGYNNEHTSRSFGIKTIKHYVPSKRWEIITH